MGIAQHNQFMFFTISLGAALLVGCGQGPTKQSARIARDLTPAKNNNQTKQPSTDSAALDKVMSAAGALSSGGTQVTAANLPKGTYTVSALSSDFYYQGSGSNTLRALHQTSIDQSGSGYTYNDSQKPQVAGSLPSNVTDAGRELDFPSQLTIPAPAASQPTDYAIAVKNQLIGGNGKTFLLSDTTQAITTGNKASVMAILAAVQPDASGVYSTQDDQSVPIALKILAQPDGKTYRIMVTFNEKTASQDPTVKTASSVTEIRDIYLDYTLKPN